jgi:hypothetical protein
MCVFRCLRVPGTPECCAAAPPAVRPCLLAGAATRALLCWQCAAGPGRRGLEEVWSEEKRHLYVYIYICNCVCTYTLYVGLANFLIRLVGWVGDATQTRYLLHYSYDTGAFAICHTFPPYLQHYDNITKCCLSTKNVCWAAALGSKELRSYAFC